MEYEEKKSFKIIHLTRKDESANVFINIKWLGESLLKKKLFKINPKLYKIWGILNPEDIQFAVNRIIESREEEKNKKLEGLNNKSRTSNPYHVLNDPADRSIQRELDQLEKDISVHQMEYEKEKQILQSSIEKLEQQELEELKKGEDKNENLSLRDQIEELETKLDGIEDAYLNKQKELEQFRNTLVGKKEEVIEREIDRNQRKEEDLLNEEEKEIEQLYEEEINKINSDYIRTQLYNQIQMATYSFFEELIKSHEIDETVPSLKENTLSNYLINEEWRGTIESLINQHSSLEAVNAIPWDEETNFIKNKLASNDPINFMELFIDGDEEGDFNQLTNNLITQIRVIIEVLFRPLPFYTLSAVRGLQQRFYQSSSLSSFDLEISLSKLLSMQYQKERAKLDFINKWIQEFEIGKQLFAEVVEGDFVKGVIQDFEENGAQFVNLADKGLGVSQLLPIIIAAADAIDSGMLICVEEPGTHLHPKLQSRLVDFVTDGNSNNTNFLFETHSEYFIRKLQWKLANSKSEIAPSDIQIIYLSKNSNKLLVISIDSDGELVSQDGTRIEKFGEGFLDESTRWINERTILKRKNQEKNHKMIKDLIEEGNKVVFCENKNAEHYNALGLSGLWFIGVHDKRDVYFKYLNFKETGLGLADRDYLADFEVQKITSKLQNFFLLNYYCFENYLYHPDNISELTGKSPDEYAGIILEEKQNLKYKLITKAIQSRASYDFLKPSQKIFKDTDLSKGNEEVIKLIESNEFEAFFKVFDMKRFCMSYRESLNISKKDLTNTSWFRQQITAIIKPSIL